MIRDIEPHFHPVRLPVVSDEAVYDRHRLRLHSSTRDPFAYLAAGDVIELSDVVAAPVVAFDRAMLGVPLEDIPLCVDPSRPARPRHCGHTATTSIIVYLINRGCGAGAREETDRMASHTALTMNREDARERLKE